MRCGSIGDCKWPRSPLARSKLQNWSNHNKKPKSEGQQHRRRQSFGWIFSASVEAPPTQDNHVSNSRCCQQSGRSSLQGNESPGASLYAGWCERGLGVIRVPIPIMVRPLLIIRRGRNRKSAGRPCSVHLGLRPGCRSRGSSTQLAQAAGKPMDQKGILDHGKCTALMSRLTS